MALAIHRLTRAMNGLRLSGSSMVPRASSYLITTRFTSTQTEALPMNLQLAEERPVRPPRVIQTALQAEYLNNGDVNVKVVSFNDLSELESRTLDGSVFGAATRIDILHRVVRWQLAARRSGNHKSKTRTETSGSTRKPWKQKGSGRARVGDIRAPQWRGGYRVHGPVVRDHSYSLPKKVRAMGLRVALSSKLREGKFAIVDSLDVESVKTRTMKELLEARGWDHALFIDGEEVSTNFLLATRNLPYVDILPQHKINVYSILQKDLLVITADAIKYLENRLHTE